MEACVERRRMPDGFSLVELLVVIGLLTILAGLTLPAVQASRETASRAACQDRLRQIGIAIHNHHASVGRLPWNGGVITVPNKSAPPEDVLTWMATILPQFDQSALYAQAAAACKADARANLNPPHTAAAIPVAGYTCPSDPRLLQPLVTPSGRTVAFASYIGVSGTAIGPALIHLPDGSVRIAPGAFYPITPTRLTDVSDGTSTTLMVAERPPPASLQAGEWYQSGWIMERFGGPTGVMAFGTPRMVAEDPCSTARYGPGRLDNPCDRYHFWSLHRGGANFAFCDGSVRFLAYSADPIMPALATRAGGEVVELP